MSYEEYMKSIECTKLVLAFNEYKTLWNLFAYLYTFLLRCCNNGINNIRIFPQKDDDQLFIDLGKRIH